VVGCAIGTPTEISDEAAITFSASFYSAIAFGESVLAAYNQARAALRLEHVDESEYPELVARPGVDPARLVLVEPEVAPYAPPSGVHAARRPGAALRWAAVALATVALSTGAAVGTILISQGADGDPPESGIQRLVQPPAPHAPAGSYPASEPDSPAPAQTRSVAARKADPAPASSTPADPFGAGADMAAATALYEAENYAAAFPLFARAAQDENPEAMGYLGIMYLQGQGTARWPESGILWLRQAAAAHDPRGMNALGVAYERGDGVDQSYRWARHWYLAAAQEKAYPRAMLNLGNLYRQGLGVQQSDEQALSWYQKAAHAGLPDAMVDAGMMYEHGWGTPRDEEAAVRWYRRAAEAGSERGMFSMGRVYQEAVGVPRDYAQAMAWYRKAVEAGSADAMNNLGVLYHNGWGVRANRAAAVRWFRQAAAAGSAVAAGNLDALGTG
jgi:TPR repeat protein